MMSSDERRDLTLEERQLAREIDRLVCKLAPQLLDQPGVGTAGRSGPALLVASRTAP
jgi:hypothetical protein